MKRTIVVIGGVAVGASAAARMRRLSEEDNIIILEKDEFISFANCGLPYYIGNVIKDRNNLILQDQKSMKDRFNIDVRIFSEAKKIDRNEKLVYVYDKVNEKEYTIKYDKIVLAPGANPIIPPISGIESAKNIFKLRSINDTDLIKNYIKSNDVKKAVIVGAGFIGVELAENLKNINIDVTILDLAKQVMVLFDDDMAAYIEKTLLEHDIKLMLETSIQSFQDGGKQLILTDGTSMETDMVIMAIGVAPETKLAREAGLDLGVTNAIKVNEFNQTSDPDIYAGGDAIEVLNSVSHLPTKIALAWPANRQGRLIADNINNLKTPYNGTMGSAVIKIFDNIAATTGLNERMALDAGYNATSVHVHRENHAGYYPGSSIITIKLVFDLNTRKVLGAQAFGMEGTEKRIDVIATALKFRASVDDLTDLELCYAPPFSSAKDPVNIAGYVASNVANQTYIPFYNNEVAELIESKAQMIDVRTKEEFDLGNIETSIHISIDDLRDNLDKVDASRDVYLICRVGLRSYMAACILKENGFEKRIYSLSGGYKLYSETKK